MPTLHQPIIRESDYEMFRELLRDDLPASHEKWLLDQQAESDGWIALWQEAQPEDITGVEVYPAEFNAWCKNTNNTPNRHALSNFAHEKASKDIFR